MKNYLIIGGSSGIGKATVELLEEQGHRVFATYARNPITKTSGLTSYHQLDVTNDNPDLEFVDTKIDGLVYCPGAIKLKPFRTLKPKDFLDDYNLQVLGLVRVVQSVLPKLNPEASIVCYSTVAVQKGFNFHSLVGSSKGALEGLVKSLAAELAPKFRVNAIAPSIVNSPLAATLLNTEDKIKANDDRHPLKRIGTAKDIANMTSFLLSDNSSWITGQVFHVDGGKSTINN